MHTKPVLIVVILVSGLSTFVWVTPSEGSSPPAAGLAGDLQLRFGLWACLLGASSAVSLPLGALAGVLWRPSAAWTAALAAFGAEALLTARLGQGEPALLEVIPYTLIAGLFLSNFPEALSSSVGMRYQGWNHLKILVLWLSLVLVTAVGSAVGYGIGSEVNPAVVSAIEGLAAGAMLTMIAQTMIPEAVHLGGASVVGLSTLAGFLAAVAFKILEA